MKKMQKMIAVLFSVAMCAAMAGSPLLAGADNLRNEEEKKVITLATVG